MKRRGYLVGTAAVSSPLFGGCLSGFNDQSQRVPYFEINNYSDVDVAVRIKILDQNEEYLYKDTFTIAKEELTDPFVVAGEPDQLVVQIDNNQEIVKSWPAPGTVCGSDPESEPPGVTIQLENADTGEPDVDVYLDWECNAVQSTSTRAE